MPIIEAKGLSFSYDKRSSVLNDVTVSFPPQSLVAILGRNGCGKSTFIDCLSGFNKPQSGVILVNGEELTSYSKRGLAKQLAFVPQSTTLNMDYTVREFIGFGRTPFIPLDGRMSKEDNEFVERSAEICRVVHLLDKTINKLSGGEKQLCYIARALAQDSKAIIMDEPLSSLDYGNQKIVLNLFKTLRENGKTIIFTTHNPEQLSHIDCEVISFKDGTVFDRRKSSDVLDPDFIDAVYGFRELYCNIL